MSYWIHLHRSLVSLKKNNKKVWGDTQGKAIEEDLEPRRNLSNLWWYLGKGMSPPEDSSMGWCCGRWWGEERRVQGGREGGGAEGRSQKFKPGVGVNHTTSFNDLFSCVVLLVSFLPCGDPWN